MEVMFMKMGKYTNVYGARQNLLYFLMFVVFVVLSMSATPIDARVLAPGSPFNTRIPATATYTRDERIGTFKLAREIYSSPIYRLSPTQHPKLVRVINDYSGRIEKWPIPGWAQPATGIDRHMVIIHGNTSYEMWNARWVDRRRIRAGGMYAFPLNDDGITDVPNQRLNAGGWSTLVGMVLREDYLDPLTGKLDPNRPINHALVISVPRELIRPNVYVYPAIAGYSEGTADAGGFPNGALLALPRNLNVDNLNVHPFTRELLRAARDYGLYLNDANGSPLYKNKHVATIRTEPGLVKELYGVSNDNLTDRIGEEIYNVIQQHGIYLVTP
jgi:hypothetical protein